MTENVADIAGRRALARLQKAKDGKSVSVADCLRAALHMVEAGEMPADLVFVCLATREDAEGDQSIASLNTGGSAFEMMGLLHQTLVDYTANA